MLKERMITAVIMAAVILAALFILPVALFQLLIVAVFTLAAWEWADLSSVTGAKGRCLFAAVLGLLIVVFSTAANVALFIELDFLPSVALRDIVGLGVLCWAMALLWVMTYPGSAAIWGHKIARMIMGTLVIVPSAVALLYVVTLADGAWLFLYLVGIVAAADIGAYFSGRKFGKAKLAPKVSPGKSWAGFFGGAISVLIYAVAVVCLTDLASLSKLSWILITLVASLASVLGDLLESMVKRHRGIKDSSQLLPGHGGIMDRVDSMTAAAPVFVLLLVLLSGQ